MRAPLSWIRDFTPADAPVGELVAALNQLGLEVDAVEEPGREIRGVRVARILDVLPHPDADKLQLADVDVGDGQTRVVCGAPNIYPGMVAPFAPAGAELPGGFKLERRKIRGVVSDGMLCSARELGLGDDHAGILELDGGSELGSDVREVLGLDDVVFELAITPNRPDAMCIVGVARELAGYFGDPLTLPDPAAPTDPDVVSDVTVVVEAPDACPRYLARVASVVMGESPVWMQQRLVKAGMRPISNVVDVTNYVLLERNQPLHAFDLGKLGGRGIVVRRAEPEERMTTLDGTDRELSPEDLLICDGERRPQAIAGIMGGATSEVSDATTEILLESAYFERMGIARTSKRLKLRSESSARFERGIDPDAVASNAERAMELFAEVAGARVAAGAVDAYPAPVERARITLRTSRVNRLLGTELTDRDVLDALVPLGIEVSGSGDDLVALAPTFRPDLEREIDLIEEVARRVGFDSIGRTVARPVVQVGALTHAQRDRRTIADACVGAGLSEAITLPLVSPADLARAGAPVDRVVEAANPLRAEESVLRTSILPGLLRAVAYNRTRGLPDVALFELGRVFLKPAGGQLLPDETYRLAVAIAATVARRPVESDRPVDAYDTVDVVRTVLAALEIEDWRLDATTHPGFHPSRTAVVSVAGAEVGLVGEVDPGVLDALELTGPIAALELDVDALISAPRRDRAFRAPSPYPPSGIDLAFVVPEGVAAGAVATTLRLAGGDLVEDVLLFDVFRSDALGAGRKSLAFSIRYRASDRTLTDAEVAGLRDTAIAAVTGAYDAALRG
jgi:phenylalanyl-tRNA synthetase beta chain